MTPRVELVWLDVDDGPSRIAQVVRDSGHSRFIVGKGGLDDVLGIVHVRALLGQSLEGRTMDLRAAIRPAPVLYDKMPVIRALETLREARTSMGLVVDEYGEVEGIITVEDLLEAVVGDMPERGLGEEPAIFRRADGTMLMDGLLPLDEVKLALDLETLPDEATYHTLAGLIMGRLGRMPGVGDSVAYGGRRFEVVDMDGRRIDKVLVSPNSANQEEEGPEGA